MLKFSATHEWALTKGNIATVGLTRFAADELEKIVHLELPIVGTHMQAEELAVVVESTKAAIDIYTPLSGQIIEINGALKQNPGLVNQAPQESGWLFKISLSQPDELEKLMDEKAYLKSIGF